MSMQNVDPNQITSTYLIDRLSTLLADFPCAGRRVALVSPTYGHSDPHCQKDVRLAVMTAAAYGVVWIGDASPERMGFSVGRNVAAQNIYEDKLLGDDVGIMWIDSDMRMEPNAIAKLIAAAVGINADFMTGVYFQRGKPFAPLFFHFNTTKKKFQNYDNVPDNLVAPCEGCGFGFVYTTKRALVQISKWKGFSKKRGWFPDDSHSGGFSEDLNFCHQAMQAGVQLYVHTGVRLGHLGEPKVITEKEWREALPTQPTAKLFIRKEDNATDRK